MGSKQICVIGAGPSGLTSIKQCLDDGFQVVCFEKADTIGGLWFYRDDDMAGLPSVAKSTIINTSKEMTAFSDFPPPAEYPNFMDNALMLKYIESYANHYKLRPHIRLMHEVINVSFNDDYNETGKWLVQVRDLSTEAVTETVFDAVMYCGGHHSIPNLPEFPEQTKFKGTLMHTHSYKKPAGMNDKIAVVVGCGNSALDAAVELARVCSQVYLSFRRGSWVAGRLASNGCPADFSLVTRFRHNLSSFIPSNLKSTLAESVCNFRFDHEKYGLKPSHRFFSRHITVNDGVHTCIATGKIRVRKNIKKFTEKGVIFEGESTETKCDVVVFGTGYKISFPCFDNALTPLQDNKVRLYKSVFNPNLKHPNTLAFISIVQPTGSILPIGEMQARWFVQLVKGSVKLPSVAEMNADIDNELSNARNGFAGSGIHTTQVGYAEYMEEIAGIVGVKPNLLWYFLVDPKLWYKLSFGPLVSYHYRLEGPHAWLGARHAILTVYDRYVKALRS